MVLRNFNWINWITAIAILALLAGFTRLVIGTVVQLSGGFYLPF